MGSHIHDATKALATPLCGAIMGVCVDSDQAGCSACRRALLAERRCVFCPIITGDAPGQILDRDDEHVVLVPLGPHVPGHVLIVPTYHLPDATTNPGLTAAAFERASRYVRDLGIEANIITSVGPAATQSVPHLHVHVIPRGSEDGLPERWPWIPAPADLADPTEAGGGK